MGWHNGYAQQFKQSIAYSVRDVSASYFLGEINGEQAILLNTDTGYVVKLFNDAMAEITTISPKYLSADVSHVGIGVINNELQMAFVKKNKTHQQLFFARHNINSKQPQLPLLLDTVATNKNTSKVQIGKSKNGKHLVAWYDKVVEGDSMVLYYSIIHNSETMHWQQVNLGKIVNKFSNRLEISNAGEVIILNSEKDAKGNIAATNYYFPHISANAFTTLPDDGKVCNSLISSINDFTNTMHVWQWFTEVETGKLFMQNLVLNIKDGIAIRQSKTIEVETENELDISNAVDGIFLPRQILFTDSHNSACVSEFYIHEMFQQAISPMENMMALNALGRRGDRTINRYISGNVLINTLIDSNSVSSTVVRKEQVAEGQPSNIASYAMVVLPSGLHFFHNVLDRVGNILITTVKPNNMMASNMLESSAKYAGVALYEQYKQCAYKQLMVPCIERDGVSFLQLNFD